MIQVARTNANGARMRRGREPVGPGQVGLLLAQRAQGQRRAGVHQHGGAGDDADQLAPARERQQEQQTDDRGEDDAEHRHLARGARVLSNAYGT